MNDSGVYMIINKIDKKFYLGGTYSFKRRFQEHKNSLNKGIHHSIYIQRAWDKYGEDAFEFKIIFLCPKEDIDFYEQKYLDKLKPYLDAIGYNMNYKVDSRLNRPMSLQARKKMSIAKKGKPSHRKGVKLTEETKKKLSESHKGQKPSAKCLQVATERMMNNKYRKGVEPWNKNNGDYMSGENNHFFGKTHLDETKEKMRIRAKNRISNRKGQKCPKETREKMSISHKRYWEIKKQELCNLQAKT